MSLTSNTTSRPLDGRDALARLKEVVKSGKPIVGAGAGTGISAKFIEEGGADLIIIYNSGRFRMAGRGSLAGLMPYVSVVLCCALNLSFHDLHSRRETLTAS